MSAVSALIETPLGPVGLYFKDGALSGVDLEPGETARLHADSTSAIAEQLKAYFQDADSGFDLRLELRGTPFQVRVWNALRQIPSGRTVTYGELARKLGTSARAVGGACRANPCPIVVPCHRVVAVSGLGGFAGDKSGSKLEAKRWLLRHEGAVLPETASDSKTSTSRSG